MLNQQAIEKVNRDEEPESKSEAQQKDKVQRKRHKLAHPNGGLCINDENGLVRPGFIDMVGNLVKKVVTMQFYDILKTPPPAFIYYPRTYLESACIDLSFAQKFMTKAALTRDPIQRLKYVICMYVSGQHINPSQIQLRAPLNPILGETLQRVLPDGTQFYGEQTSYYPPITNFLCEGPDNLFRFSGYFEYKAWISGFNSIGGSRIGKQVMTFQDGGLLSIKDPQILVSGLAVGNRNHSQIGSLYITDHINQLEVEVQYNPQSRLANIDEEDKGLFDKFKSKISNQKPVLQPTDYIKIEIREKGAQGNYKVVSRGKGSWLEEIEFDGQILWTIDEEIPEWSVPVTDPKDGGKTCFLPSDSTFRKDINFIRNKQFEEARQKKREMEIDQRKDLWLRNIAAEALERKQQRNTQTGQN